MDIKLFKKSYTAERSELLIIVLKFSVSAYEKNWSVFYINMRVACPEVGSCCSCV